MTRIFKRHKRQIAQPPGTIDLKGDTGVSPRITVFQYGESVCREKELHDVKECSQYRRSPGVTWINIEGISPRAVSELDDIYEIHPLVAEDIINLGQRPKAEDYEEHLFIVLRMFYLGGEHNDIMDEQVSLVLGRDFVLSFQERPGDVFDPIRERIRQAKGRVRRMGADYLAYTLLDAIVDNYYTVIDQYGEDIEDLDDELLRESRPDIVHRIHHLKRNMIYLRKQIWPLREVLSGLQRGESRLIKKTTNIYLRDVYDHLVQVADTVESFRDMLSGLHDVYLSSMSNRMNEIMKVLTIFAAIFIPLTFIAGIYGMNFEYMPELRWRWGYFMVLGFMALVGLGLIAYFRKKDWL
ncbi:MAG: magnesium/cobalt transporter CorA [Candidatus Omnitrophota bacterium]